MARYVTAIVFLAMLVSTCGDDSASPEVWAKGWYRTQTPSDISLEEQSFVLWNDGDDTLYVESAQRAKKTVMLRVQAGSVWEEQLRNDTRTLMFKPPEFNKAGTFILELDSGSELDKLASQSHYYNHSCGGIVVLQPRATDAFKLNLLSKKTFAPVFDTWKSSSEVTQLLAKVSKTKIDASIKRLEALGTRMHSHSSGKLAGNTVYDMFNEVIAASGYDASIAKIDHTDTEQKSVVVTITGTSTEKVILGAHLDSINSKEESQSNAPGADDDASGIATLVEVFRVLAEDNIRPKRTLEFHAYAAEEVGLLGSQALARRYENEGASVTAMMQMDMNAYSHNKDDATIYLVESDTDPTLTRRAKNLIHNYLDEKYVGQILSAGTSDHKSWSQAGFAAVFPFENPDNYNEALHTPQDTSSTINNLNLSVRFAKLGIAFSIHEAGDIALNSEDFRLGKAVSSKEGSDLNVAIVADTASTEGSKYFASIATSTATKRVEICSVGSRDSTACTDDLRVLGEVLVKDDRIVYSTPVSESFDTGQLLLITGFNDKDQRVQKRIVELSKR